MQNSTDVYKIFVYTFLSIAFSYPNSERLALLSEGLEDLSTSFKALGLAYETDTLRALLEDAGQRLLDLEGEFNRLFSTGVSAPAVETAYEEDRTARRAAELADIRGFYTAFGVDLARPLEPDHIVAELEFLAYLLQKKRYAEEMNEKDAALLCDDAYKKFLHDHAGRWYSHFSERLLGTTDDLYYRALCGLLTQFFDSEVSMSKDTGEHART